MAGPGQARMSLPPQRIRACPFSDPITDPEGAHMAPPLNPKNVPTGGQMTYAALERITSKQLRMISHLRRTAGNPPTWDATCGLILGDDWDGVYETLSVAAGSWLIHGLQRGLLAVAEKDDLYIEGSPV